MTVLLKESQPKGGTRVLILGGASYPYARGDDRRVPVLDDISSATESAIAFACGVLGEWRGMFLKPLASVEALINHPAAPDGATWTPPLPAPTTLEAPTVAAIKEARKRWLADARPDDVLIFYCCGHGIWLPSRGRTFLATDFGSDPEAPWAGAIDLDEFQQALGEKPPRTQWLIYDCCANTPSEAMGASPNPTQLLTPMAGERAAAEQKWGPLSQVRVAAASTGAMAYGRRDRPSRFMEAFRDACSDAGFLSRGDDGRWRIDSFGLDKAMATFAQRRATLEDERYYTFPRAIESDAASPPGLMARDKPSPCTLLVESLPGILLKQGDLTISALVGEAERRVASQSGGPQALTPFRWSGDPFVNYRLELALNGQSTPKDIFGLPPLVKAVF